MMCPVVNTPRLLSAKVRIPTLACAKMISLLATASSALIVSPSARTAAAHRCGEARMQVAPGTKLLVIGGNGYVGREVCKNAVQMGYAVTSLSRRGECPDASDPLLSQVEWRAGNALDKPTIKEAVGNADAVSRA